MPKYEIYVQDKVTYEATYEAENEADAWRQFYIDRYSRGLIEIDSDNLCSYIEEIPEDA